MIAPDMAGGSSSHLSLSSSLRPYQRDGVAFLATRSSALLADEMGLGKTVQVAVALRALAKEVPAVRVLVVCPASLKWNWERELQKWANDVYAQQVTGPAQDRYFTYLLPVPVLIASYEQVRSDRDALSRVSFDLVVLDEAQRIKNSDADASLACRILARDRSWALTGTPLENAVDDMVSVFQFVRQGLLYSGMGRDDLHAAIKPFFMRRRKREVLPELPPVIEQELPLEMVGAQLEAYRRVWATRRAVLSKRGWSHGNLLALLTELKKLCNYDPVSEESVKLDALRMILEETEAAGEKVVVFSQYVQTLRWLQQKLDSVSFFFHGAMTPAQRDSTLSAFREHKGDALLLMSLKAGGVGLNIPEASVVVLYDRWWNPAVEQQAIERAHRFGRDGSLHAIRFAIQDSVEERILQVLREKEFLFDEIVEAAESADLEGPTEKYLTRILDLVD